MPSARGFASSCAATAEKLLGALLLAAALLSSLSAVLGRFRFGFGRETARKAIHSNLPDLAELTQGLLDALYLFGSGTLRRREWVIALDEHLDPFYGDLASTVTLPALVKVPCSRPMTCSRR